MASFPSQPASALTLFSEQAATLAQGCVSRPIYSSRRRCLNPGAGFLLRGQNGVGCAHTEGGPIGHEQPSLFQCIAVLVGPFDVGTDRMGKSEFAKRPIIGSLLADPCPEAETETMNYRRSFRYGVNFVRP